MLPIGRVGVGLSLSEPTNLKHCQYLPHLPYTYLQQVRALFVMGKYILLFSIQTKVQYLQIYTSDEIAIPLWKEGNGSFSQCTFQSHMLVSQEKYKKTLYYHGHSDLTCMEIRFGIQSQILLAKVLLLRQKRFQIEVWKYQA